MPTRPSSDRIALARLLLCLALSGSSAAAAGDGERPENGLTPDGHPSLRVLRVETPPVIDGRLDEAAWRTAPMFDEMRQIEPNEGELMSVRTEIRFLYDRHTLYLGIRAYDDPAKITANTMSRDELMMADDAISVRFDTFLDERNAFQFGMNPIGNRVDSLIEGGEFKVEWDGIWQGKSRIDEQGWVAEMAIPFQTVGFRPGSTSWGFQALRVVRRTNEMGVLVNSSLDRNVMDMTDLARLEGLEGIEQGLGLDVKPSVSLRHRRGRDDGRRVSRIEPSLDVFYKLTPSVTAALTFNTDFAEAAVDDRQVNLTRFGLLFPEQRDFFLQDARIFSFAGKESGNGIPFFSRRIGIADDGQIVDIDAGAKVTGRVGRLNLGLLSVRMESQDEVDAGQLSVARARINVMEGSTLGFLGTLGDPNSDDANAALGFDFNYRTTKFRGDRSLEASLWNVRSFSEGSSGQESAFGGRVAYPNDRYQWSLSAQELQRNFNPALGFVNRTDIRDYAAGLRRRWRPGGPVHTADVGMDGALVTDTSNRLESLELDLTALRLGNSIGDGVGLHLISQRERLDEPFEISEDVFLPIGDYRFDRAELQFDFSNSRDLNGTLTLGWGKFWSGHRFETDASLRWYVSRHLNLTLNYQQNDVRLPEGAFTTRLARLRVMVQITPDITWNSVVQYDNVSDTVGIHSRLRWIFEPGNEIFLVVNHGYEVPDRRLRTATSQVAAKLGWTFRF